MSNKKARAEQRRPKSVEESRGGRGSPNACVTARIDPLKSVENVGCNGNSDSMNRLQNHETSCPNSPWPSKQAMMREEDCSQCFISSAS